MTKYVLGALLTVGIGLTGCTKEETNGLHGEGEGMMRVSLAGSSGTRAVVEPGDDSRIYDFRVYVFAANSGALEKAVQGNIEDEVTEISGLNTSTTKKVVVLTNLGAEENYPAVSNYADFTTTIQPILLDRQTPELANSNGYIMSGISENPITLTPDVVVKEMIAVKRVVARISLASITVSPEAGTDISNFRITGVSVQRVASELTLSPVRSYYGEYHYGGFGSTGEELEVTSFLADDLEIEGGIVADKKYEFNNYFLVFPNGNEEGNATLLTIRGELDGELIYYPIKVNYREGAVNTDGYFVESNKHYQLNVTLKNIQDGTTDPEVPGEDADLEVEIVVEDWEVITQNEIW